MGLNGARRFGRLLAMGAALTLASAAAMPAAAQTEQPVTAEEAEFIRLAEEVQERQEAGDPAGAAPLIERLATLGERVAGLGDPDFQNMLEAQIEYLVSHERRAEVVKLAHLLHAGRVQALGADDPKTIEALIIKASSLSVTGDYAAAEPLMVEALERAERVLGREHEATLLALNNFAVLRLEQGRLAEAEPLLQRALTAREKVLGQDNEETLDSLGALSTLYRAQGRLDESEPLMRRVVATRERILGAGHPSTLYALNSLAVLLGLRDEHEAAGETFAKVEAAGAELGPDHPMMIEARDGRAYSLVMTGKLQEAEPIAREALAARERVQGPNHPATVRATSILANIYLLSDRPALAEPLLMRAKVESERRLGAAHPDTLTATENVVYARLSGPAAASALETARQLVAGERQRRSGGAKDVYGQMQSGRAGQGRSAGRRFTMFADAAFATTQASGKMAEPMLLAEVMLALQEAVAGQGSASIGRMAVRRYLEGRGDGLAELVREREGLSERWTALSDQIAQSFNALNEDSEQERSRLRTQREQAEARMTAIDERIRRDFPEYFDLVRPQPLQGPEIQALLQPDEAVVIAVPGAFGTHVLGLSKDRVEWARANLTEQEVERGVNGLRFDAGAAVNVAPEVLAAWQKEQPADGRPTFDRNSAFQLYRALFEPVERVLKDKKRVYVVAGGSLAGLPFSMLVTRAPEGSDEDPAALRATEWLGDRYALVHVPSLYSLAFLRGPAGKAAGGGFVGFGDPALAGQATSRGARRGATVPAVHEVITTERTPWGGAVANVAALRQMEQLPGTARELKAMADIFGSSRAQLFTRASATEAQVRSADLSQARVIAFATHGLTPADPVGEASASELFELAEPGLVMTPPAEASAQDDGFLSASEVATLRLNADWVILSACNTATGDAATAGLSQLARAFFYAGARNLLASHWPVDDEVAAKMTVRTLALEQSGTPRAEAFQQAMREIRNDPARPEWAHPFYWSPFVLIGDGGK